MAGLGNTGTTGLGGFMNRKHPQAAVRENIAPVAPPNLQQRQSAASLFKLPVPGNAIKQHSVPGSGYPSRSAAHSPVRTGSPLPYQQSYTQHATLTQTTVQGNIQDQGYSQPGISAWAESTLGTDSDDTARDESQNVYNEMDVESDHDEERNGIFKSDDDQRMGQDGQSFDGEEDEEEGSEEDQDQFNMPQQRRSNSVIQLPIANVSIPMRSGYTNRFSGEPQHQQLQPNGDGAMIEDEKHVAHLGHQQSPVHNQFPIRDSFAPSEMDEDTVHSDIDGKSQAARSSAKRPHATTVDLDFDQEKLFQMPYEELKTQAFEDDPKSTKLGKTLQANSHEGLEVRLDLYKETPKNIQEQFFASLSIDEWEQAGEWFLKQFGQSMTKLAEARRERRNIATEFEKQFADRDAAIKKKTENLNAVFHRMQSGGESILRGKTPL